MSDQVSENSQIAGTDSDLCRSCGFCCDGTLFNLITPTTDEPGDHLVRIGLKIITLADSSLQISQPCPQFTDCCGIYNQRPEACRTFRCGLLKSVTSGTLSREATGGIVRKTKSLLKILEPAISGATSLSGPSDPFPPSVMRARRLLDVQPGHPINPPDSVAFRPPYSNSYSTSTVTFFHRVPTHRRVTAHFTPIWLKPKAM